LEKQKMPAEGWGSAGGFIDPAVAILAEPTRSADFHWIDLLFWLCKLQTVGEASLQ
jgi:hypothetical protein